MTVEGHVLTPGDHYSPATGSAVSTVVLNLAKVRAEQRRPTLVAVQSGTYADRYAYGEVVEYATTRPASRREATAEALLSRFVTGRGRPRAGRGFAKAAAALAERCTTTFFHNALSASVYAPRLQGESVLYAHNDLFRTYSRREARTAAGRFAHVIVVSNFLRHRLLERGVPEALMSVAMNGVDAKLFAPAPILGDRETVEVLFLGRVVPEKGLHLAIKALLRLRHLDFTLTIVGSSGFDVSSALTKYEQSVRRLASPLGERVQFRAFEPRAQVAAAYSAADIFVAPSAWDDPCPLTVLEALASGLPVVTTRRGGIPEIMGDLPGVADGLDEITSRLEWWLKDRQARLMDGEASRLRAEQLSWSRTQAALDSIGA